MRRNARQLLADIKAAKAPRQKAKAFYALALFHDNNSRKSEAIPYYRKAIRLGLDKKREAMAMAWLASSLYKVGRLDEAQKLCGTARKMATDSKLAKFLDGLHNRIEIKQKKRQTND